MKKHRIAVIAGDGIGKEVMPEGLRALEAAAARFEIDLEFAHFEWASCDYYLQHGKMMPDDWKQQLDGCEAIFFGAVGWPDTVPDHISLWGSLLLFRREFDQYINLRPVRLMPGVLYSRGAYAPRIHFGNPRQRRPVVTHGLARPALHRLLELPNQLERAHGQGCH